MQNINPIYLLEPIAMIAMSVASIIYWRKKRTFRLAILGIAALAYFSAIIVKIVFQFLTYTSAVNYFGTPSVGIGLYFGLQTSFLEVGLAYVFARYLRKRIELTEKDAGAYGISLGFWENAVFIGALMLINLLTYYFIIGYGPQSYAQLIYNSISSASPSLFYSTSKALPLIGLALLERFSSLLAHFAWGFLVVVSIVRRKPLYFLIAMPMGLLDALVPYAGEMGIVVFEIVIFLLALLFITIAWIVYKREFSDSVKGSVT